MASLSVQGTACTLSNQRLTLTFSEDAKATSLVFDGRELLANLSGAAGDPDREHSFYCDYHVGGHTQNLKPTRLDVLSDGPELVHIAYVDETSDLQLAYHVVLVDGEAAVYGYVVAASDAEDLVVNELRTVYRFDSSLFTFGYTAERQGMQPRAEYLAESGEWLQDETFRLTDGCRYTNSNIYSKYDYAGTFAENDFWGQFSGGRSDDEWGAWFIPLDKSCYPSGPLKQELLVHYDAIILNYMTGAHFGTGDFPIEPGWRKLYGPWCLYLNHGSDVIADAKARAASERASLPVPWLEEDEVYSSAYASLRGALVPEVAIDPLITWTVIASTERGDCFEQKAGRIYYDTAVSGSFELEHMQPGTYWLRAYANGTTDSNEYDLGSFTLKPDARVDAGDLAVPNRQRPLAWALGQRTHTTAPFKFSDQPRNYVWMTLTPQYHVCRVDSEDDWYYAQPAGGVWTLKFGRPRVASGRYLLTICLAGITSATMSSGVAGVTFAVSLNGRVMVFKTFDNDRAAYRSSVTGGHPHLIEVEIDASTLKDANELSFATDGYAMYDMVKLEALEEA